MNYRLLSLLCLSTYVVSYAHNGMHNKIIVDQKKPLPTHYKEMQLHISDDHWDTFDGAIASRSHRLEEKLDAHTTSTEYSQLLNRNELSQLYGVLVNICLYRDEHAQEIIPRLQAAIETSEDLFCYAGIGAIFDIPALNQAIAELVSPESHTITLKRLNNTTEPPTVEEQIIDAQYINNAKQQYGKDFYSIPFAGLLAVNALLREQ